MKKLYIILSLAVVMAVPNLFASMSVTLIDNTSQYSYNNGGEFRAIGNADLLAANPGLAGYSSLTEGTIGSADVSSWGYSSGLSGQIYFQTFCIEYNEEFSPGASYGVTISSKAMYGGQPPNGDPLSIGTAWLYSQFAAGTLSGYNYGASRTSSAGALQQAIWWLEAEPNGARNSFINTAEDALFGTHGATQDALIVGDAYYAEFGVVALNLGAPGLVQDQLFITSLTPTPVPEPTTMLAGALLLLPFGASTLRILRRNRAA
jgi:hypothetical protein